MSEPTHIFVLIDPEYEPTNPFYQVFVSGNRSIGDTRIRYFGRYTIGPGKKWLRCELSPQEVEFCNRINKMNW